VLASAGDPARAAALEKACAEQASLDAGGLARALAGRSGAPAPVVVLDPLARALELGGARLEVVTDR